MNEESIENSQQSSSSPERSNKQILLRVLIVLALVAVVLGVWGLRTTNKVKITPSSSSVTTKPAKISITATGFQPATIQVNAGTQVNWTNSDLTPHQIAADPFPKDDSISGFNSTIILQHNDTYSFTFDKIGTYTYHDERHPMQLKGTVIVR